MKPNVFIFVLDTIQRSQIKGIGTPEEPENYLERILQQGTNFTNYIEAGGTTRISVNALFNGFFGGTSGLNFHHCEGEFDKTSALSLADVFKFNGYQTLALTQGDISLLPWNFDQIWMRQEYFDLDHLEKLLTEAAQPVFSYMHFYNVHDSAFGFPERMTTENYQTLLNKLSDEIEQVHRRLVKDTDVVIIVSDHGCHLRDRYDPAWRFFYEEEPTAGMFLSDVTIRGICSIIAPGRFPVRQVTSLVRGIDIFPTLLDGLGLMRPTVQGCSLWPALQNHTPFPQLNAFIEGGGIRTANGEAICRSIRTDHWKYNRYETHGEQLFDLQQDPAEQHNLIGSHHPQEDIMRRLFADQNAENQQGTKAFYAPNVELCRHILGSRPPLPRIIEGNRVFKFQGLFDERLLDYLHSHLAEHLPRWHKKGERIVIYSASDHARTFFTLIKPCNLEMIVGLVDSNPALTSSQFFGVPVFPLDAFETEASPTVIIVAHHLYANDMYVRIKESCRQPIPVFNLYHLDREIPLWWDRAIEDKDIRDLREDVTCR